MAARDRSDATDGFVPIQPMPPPITLKEAMQNLCVNDETFHLTVTQDDCILFVEGLKAFGQFALKRGKYADEENNDLVYRMIRLIIDLMHIAMEQTEPDVFYPMDLINNKHVPGAFTIYFRHGRIGTDLSYAPFFQIIRNAIGPNGLIVHDKIQTPETKIHTLYDLTAFYVELRKAYPNIKPGGELKRSPGLPSKIFFGTTNYSTLRVRPCWDGNDHITWAKKWQLVKTIIELQVLPVRPASGQLPTCAEPPAIEQQPAPVPIKPEEIRPVIPEQPAAIKPEEIRPVIPEQPAAIKPEEIRPAIPEQPAAIKPEEIRPVVTGPPSSVPIPVPKSDIPDSFRMQFRSLTEMDDESASIQPLPAPPRPSPVTPMAPVVEEIEEITTHAHGSIQIGYDPYAFKPGQQFPTVRHIGNYIEEPVLNPPPKTTDDCGIDEIDFSASKYGMTLHPSAGPPVAPNEMPIYSKGTPVPIQYAAGIQMGMPMMQAYGNPIGMQMPIYPQDPREMMRIRPQDQYINAFSQWSMPYVTEQRNPNPPPTAQGIKRLN